MAEDTNGASPNERLLEAARTDNENLLNEVFDQGGFNINCEDGLGNTPLHNAVSHQSIDVLEYILSHEECDVDPINRLEKATPLHLAIQIDHANRQLRKYIVNSLLEAGADTWIKDKHGQTALDLLPPEETEIRHLIIKARAQLSVSRDDVASDDEDGPTDSGSDSE